MDLPKKHVAQADDNDRAPPEQIAQNPVGDCVALDDREGSNEDN